MVTRTSIPQQNGTLKKYGIRLAILAIVLSGVGWAVFHHRPETADAGKRGAGGGAIPVATAQASNADIPITLKALGTVTPLATVTVKTQIAGQLQQVAFTEGQHVRKDDFLAQIDPRPYQAQLDQYLGQLAKDQALLKAAEIDLERYKVLVAQDSIASQQLDTQTSLVAQYKGAVGTDRALVDNARLNLAYCHIVSPLNGRAGLRQVDPGNYVQTSDSNGIVVITQLQPITVVFAVPEDSIPSIMTRVHSGDPLAVIAFDRSGTTQLARGKLLTIDNQIDTTTGTIKLKAVFDNTDETLFPNQFVNTVLQLDVLRNQVTIPLSAVQKGAPGTFVYAVRNDHTVAVQIIKTGPSSGDFVSVQEGLKPGETVVTDGMDKLRDGAKIVPRNQDAPTKDGDSKP